MKILVAPNAFKGTFGAAAAAAALAAAARRAMPGAEAEELPIADGGDGLLEALRPALGGRLYRASAPGPLGEPLRARWLLAGETAVIEMAEAAGLRLCRGKLRPLDASTAGVGILLLAAARRGAKEIIVGLGGSASNDGGAGCAAAAGIALLDGAGRPIAPGARGLSGLACAVRLPGARWPRGVKVTGLSDVRNPLCGRLGSARVFGPQKGAGPREVELMESGLRRLARVAARDLGVKISDLPGGAAAGGLGAGLAAFFGARLEDGAEYVLRKTGFREKLSRAGLLITGEGRFDRQTFYGKAPGAALALARAAGVRAVVVCGSCEKAVRPGPGAPYAVVEAGEAGRTPAGLGRALAAALPGLLRAPAVP